MLKLKILGGKSLNIDQTRDFIAAGGEKTIYYLNKDEVVGIYTDLSKMIPKSKFDELNQLDKPTIIKPEKLIVNDSNQLVGFTMKNIKGMTEPLCKIFTTSYWISNRIDERVILHLVENFLETLEYIHSKDCLVVDVSELNFNFETTNYKLIYCIDVNSYQTRSFPATAITPFIRDYTASKWTTLTDYYSAAILSFKMFTGIHPYQGFHPKYSMKDTIQRMKDNASVFDKGVKLNTSIRDFSIIPSNYMTWYQDIFKNGKRLLPPGNAGLINFVQIVKKEIGADKFIIKLYKKYDSNVIEYKYVLNQELVLTQNMLYINDIKYKYSKKKIGIIFDSKLIPYDVEIENDKLILKNLKDNKKIISEIGIEDFFIVDNNLYVIIEGKILHVIFYEDRKLMVSNQWKIMPRSYEVFENIVYQNIMGKHCFFSIPVPSKDWCVTPHVKMLDGKKILNVKRSHNIIYVVYIENKQEKRCILKLNKDYLSYKVVKEDDLNDINFIVLDNGMVLNMEDESLEIFYTNYDNDKIVKFEDKNLSINMRLWQKEQKVLYNIGDEIKTLETRK